MLLRWDQSPWCTMFLPTASYTISYNKTTFEYTASRPLPNSHSLTLKPERISTVAIMYNKFVEVPDFGHCGSLWPGKPFEKQDKHRDIIYVVGVYQLAFGRHIQLGGLLGLTRAHSLRPTSEICLYFFYLAKDFVNRRVVSNKAHLIHWFVGPLLLWNKSDLMRWSRGWRMDIRTMQEKRR
jgi:hypothetical protein